ncbi:MAG: uracil-DNA glycosylase [Thermoplasmata archaeon]|nr:uracil-DNA glycosylase [Thermoplasmata archaeon]
MKKPEAVTVDCASCRLSKTRKNVVRGKGLSSSRIVFVGEAPGRDEDLRGEPFVGSAGRTLNKAFADLGVSRDDVFVTNLVKCRPPGNRKPRRDEIEACKGNLCAEVHQIEPSVLCLLGQTVTQELLGYKGRMSDLVGKEVEATVCGRRIKCVVAYHPAACLYRRSNYESFSMAIERGLQLARLEGEDLP